MSPSNHHHTCDTDILKIMLGYNDHVECDTMTIIVENSNGNKKRLITFSQKLGTSLSDSPAFLRKEAALPNITI